MDERKIERMFYHDMLNLAASMRGISEVIRDVDNTTHDHMLSMLGSLAETMLETLHARRHYRSIEAQDLTLTFSSVTCDKLVQRTADIYRQHTLCEHKAIDVLPPSAEQPISLFTDKDVLQGALGFGVRTALETVGNGQALTLGVTRDTSVEPPDVLFSIAFPGTLSDADQGLVFKKPEGTARGLTGLSAYVFHTLVTCYLKGDVRWTQQENMLHLTACFHPHPETQNPVLPKGLRHG